MILEDVPNGADFFVEATTSTDAELLRHRDLNAFNVIPVPHRFQERVREPKIQQILNRLFAEEMVDAIDRRLCKGLMKGPVECLRRGEVTAERLFDDHARMGGTSRPSESSRDGSEQAGRDRKIKQGALGCTEGSA